MVPELVQIPRLRLAKQVRAAGAVAPQKSRNFHYEARDHRDLPHVVKFSGGRSSGALLFILLESGLLKAERGDVVIFNNTSAEHPETYEFTRKCKQLVEEKYGIPFFWIEYQTYEDAQRDQYVRLESYRLVKPEPRSPYQPDGFQWRGEVFEELLSFKGYVPNQFKRICTAGMKLEVTRAFLADWFACKPGIERQGHYGDESRIDRDDYYHRHQRNGGDVPQDIFLAKKDFVFQRPLFRPEQTFADYSPATRPINNEYLKKHVYGGAAEFGDDAIEYLSLIGLRHDEPKRIMRARNRNAEEGSDGNSPGEYVYTPLNDMGMGKKEVEVFWKAQPWDLNLNSEDNLSNCLYCFLKGYSNLNRVHHALSGNLKSEQKGTPCDLQWWVNLERKYGRDLKKEQRKIKSKVHKNFIGFFGTNTGFAYEKIHTAQTKSSVARYEDGVLPCDCTD